MEKKENPKEQKSKQAEKKKILSAMRGLLNDYPIQIEFKGFQSTYDLIHNLFILKDLMTYCRYKTNDDEIAREMDKELKKFEEITSKIRVLWLSYNSTRTYGMSKKFREILNLISKDMEFITDRVQFYFQIIPTKGKKFMHLKTAHGLPPDISESFEQQEIEEGSEFKDAQTFKLDEEGKVIPVN